MDQEYITTLSTVQARILACLMEKQLATPDQYPLTQNSLLLACNQKTNRNPVMALTPGEVSHELSELMEEGWVMGDMGSRAERYEHRVRRQLNLNLDAEGKAEQAILCMLMLRGPQTLNELITRTAKMVDNEELIADRLDYLSQRSSPLVTLLPRQSGQREDRYGQLVFDQGDLPLMSSPAAKSAGVSSQDSERIDKLEQEVAELKQKVQELLDQLS